ncbi:hypothetical protein [Kangiella taiwanensis]|nr:hypothetical protein [Kangiella taiwanensis]
MTKYMVSVFLFLLMMSSGAISSECGERQCALDLQLKEGKDEAITSGHFNLVWPIEKQSTTSESQESEGDREDESSVAKNSKKNTSNIKGALIDYEQHPAKQLKISSEQSLTTISHSIDIHSTQRAISLTGFSDGIYYAQLFDNNDQPVSNQVKVTVEHHSMTKVWIIFTSGAVLFLILIGYMVTKVFRHKEEA